MFIKQQLYNKIKENFYRSYAHLGPKFLQDFTKLKIQCENSNDENMVELINDYLDGTTTSKLAKNLDNMKAQYTEAVSRRVSTNEVMDIADLFLKHKEPVYLVGGCVRDAMLEKEPKDFDFVTSMNYTLMEDMFKANGYTVKEEGKQFLVMIVSKDEHQYEIANFRKDGTYEDGRRPESVDIGTMDDDSQRRDFTCNTIYFNLISGELLDPTGQGILDIDKKILRFVGKPKDRLEEDALRAWRFLRFVDTLKFTPEKKSIRAIKSDFKSLYDKSNPQRVLQELSKFIDI